MNLAGIHVWQGDCCTVEHNMDFCVFFQCQAFFQGCNEKLINKIDFFLLRKSQVRHMVVLDSIILIQCHEAGRHDVMWFAPMLSLLPPDISFSSKSILWTRIIAFVSFTVRDVAIRGDISHSPCWATPELTKTRYFALLFLMQGLNLKSALVWNHLGKTVKGGKR